MREDIVPGPAPAPPAAWWRNRRVWAWASWDFATTPFSALVSGVVFPVFFKEIVLGNAREADFLWGLVSSLTMLLVVLLAPAAGAYADATAHKHQLLTACTLLNGVACGLFVFLGPGTVAAAMILYILAGFGYQSGCVFYNAFLSEVAPRRERGAVSGLGDGLGYVGALTSMAVALPFLSPSWLAGGAQSVLSPDRPALLFPLVAVFILVCALPSFLFVKDAGPPLAAGRISILGAFKQEWATLRHVRRYRNSFLYLLAFLLYTDVVTTMSIFVTLYGRSLNVALSEIVLIFLISLLTAVPGTFLLGKLADRIGAKPTVSGLLVLWIVMLGYGMFARGFVDYLLIGLMAGVGLGALTTVSRTLMSLVCPPTQQAEFFGFFAVAGRAAGMLGPPVFGAISSLTDEPRYGLPVLMGLLAVALVILQRVKVETGKEEEGGG